MKYDVAVIGAGAAGLAAARDLTGAGKRVCIVEARQRAGGRILTLHIPDLPLPLELGAEFIHGEAHDTFAIVEDAALSAIELPDNHWWSRGERWEEVRDFWGQIGRVTSQIGRLKKDVSFATFLASRRSLPPRLRELARSFVEGYHASHADRISALALRSADSEQEEDGGNKQFRILNGYDSVIEWLRAGLTSDRSSLLLGTTVEGVKWREGEVVLECRRTEGKVEETIRAAALVVTIPIGVWKAPRDGEGAIRFDPPLTAKEKALAGIEVGHVVKLMLRFRERFWDDPSFLRERSAKGAVNFIHSSDRFVPTWWTNAPVRSPILTAWAGGHAADALLAEGAEVLVDRALESLSKTFAMRRRTIDGLLAGTWTHDWQADPFSRGAYSYAGVGGTGAHKELARPIRSTIFFAGEATNGEQTGTVAGAVESGRRAAKEVLRAARAGSR